MAPDIRYAFEAAADGCRGRADTVGDDDFVGQAVTGENRREASFEKVGPVLRGDADLKGWKVFCRHRLALQRRNSKSTCAGSRIDVICSRDVQD